MKIVQFKDVTRTYVTGDHKQDALADVDLEIDGGSSDTRPVGSRQEHLP